MQACIKSLVVVGSVTLLDLMYSTKYIRRTCSGKNNLFFISHLVLVCIHVAMYTIVVRGVLHMYMYYNNNK